MNKNFSQRDLAKILKVNVSTISRALKGSRGVSPSLREKIKKLAEEVGYRPNPFAMSLRYDTTRTIGVIVPDLSFSHFAHMVKVIESEARKAGYMCVITDSDETLAGEIACTELLENLHVDGVILCLSQETSDFSHLEKLRRNHVPVVLFDRTADIDISKVAINDISVAHQATLHLIKNGARRIAFLGGPNLMKQTSDRKHGYLEALREKNIPIKKDLVKCNHISYNSGLSDTLDLLNLPEPPDAIIATNGLLAGAAFRAIKSRGLKIPEEISVVGFMSDWVSEAYQPRITFIKQNLKDIGRKAFKLLSDQLNGDETKRDVVVKARLEIRESTRNSK